MVKNLFGQRKNKMREIKFRAWDTVMQEWVKSKFLQDLIYIGVPKNLGNGFFNIYQFDPPRYKIIQHTGLKDKNGKEIYEGDIVTYDISQTQHYKGIIDWCKSYFVTKYFYNKNDAFMKQPAQIWHTKGMHRLDEELLYNLEILGNIYENPELLK